LRECYAEGAKRFGWADRRLEPRQMTDENGLLVGWGMGTAIFHSPMNAADARATILPDGTGLVETAGADMGQGAWTALAQIAADGLGLPIDKVQFRSGSSDLPNGGVAGGSSHTATAGTALHNAGADAVAKLGQLAAADERSSLFGLGNQELIAREGRLYAKSDESRSEAFEQIIARAGGAAVVGQGSGARTPGAEDAHAMYSHGAVFAEVKVDPELFQIRVTRLVGAFAAGRIINPRLAKSQLSGGMIWGVGFALLEEAKPDRRTGRVMNADLAGYHVPVNADITGLEVLTIHEDDPYVNSLDIKGVGETGITGTVGAIANALWHATGVRVRRFPIRIEDLLAGA
jgi:xanthine dehydrogenase YagR molybdenum-binding subunit